MHRFREVLVGFVEDGKLAGKCPLPRSVAGGVERQGVVEMWRRSAECCALFACFEACGSKNGDKLSGRNECRYAGEIGSLQKHMISC